jgi:transposase
MDAIRSRIPQLKAVVKMLRSHLERLLNYILHPINNAATEGFNCKIQALRHAARGFRSFDNHRVRILFCCGKLSTLP